MYNSFEYKEGTERCGSSMEPLGIGTEKTQTTDLFSDAAKKDMLRSDQDKDQVKTIEPKQGNSQLIKTADVAASISQEQSKLKMNHLIHLAEVPSTAGEEDMDSRNREDWRTVLPRRNRNKNKKGQKIIGDNKDSKLVKAVPKFVDLHVTRMKIGTTETSLSNLLKETFPEIIKVTISFVMMDLRVILFLSSYFIFAAADILVTTHNGIIRGRQEYSNRGISFYAFQQIPFAKPPVGELRFREPQPAEKWEGILDATVNTKACYQMNNTYNTNISAMESEDCLYLNVYTPRYPSADLSLPVMFYIYGGGFVKGASAIDFGGPHYLMESDVIVVAVNYRVGPFGFLSTGDTVIPGNYGLKDQQMGLRWVRDNIQSFGGDPEKVTIFGQSAGGASVTFQLLNKQSEGLFRAAIAESGTFLNPWSYQRDYKEFAYKLATTIDENFNKNSSTQELLEFLRSVPATEIKAAAESFKEDVRNSQIVQGFFFTPVVEPEHETAFEFVRKSICPFIRDDTNNFEDGLKEIDEDITLLVNKNMHLKDEKQLKDAGEAIRNIYTNGSLYENEGDLLGTTGLCIHTRTDSPC
ncbi:hypothetical protein JTB14_030709 [Gonioctena quinquepunctata]|nr:hypothetical protein JTB14_030709 [Gonioctena quinquepunctata]